MSKSRLILSVGLSIILLFGCRASRILKNVSVVGAKDSTADMMMHNYFLYDWFSAHAKITVINSEGRTEFGATIKAKKDSAIWISISPGLGIEVARVMMTKDSVQIIDRINKKYYSRDYSVLKDYTSLPVTLETMENILAGIPIYFDDKKSKTNRQDTLTMLTSGKNKIKNTLYLNPDYTLWRMNLIDSAMGKSLNLKYKDYNRENATPFALDREMELNDDKHTNVFVSFSRVKVNEPQKMPFNVKEKYE